MLWKHLSVDRRRQAAEAFWGDTAVTAEHAEAVSAIAKHLKFRPKSVAVLPAPRKAQYLVALPVITESVALRLLMYYHIGQQRPMMGAFLDELGIKHDNGLISDETVVPPDEDKIRAAVQKIAGSFPATDVALYLSTLSWQDTETWALLPTLPETNPTQT